MPSWEISMRTFKTRPSLKNVYAAAAWAAFGDWSAGDGAVADRAWAINSAGKTSNQICRNVSARRIRPSHHLPGIAFPDLLLAVSIQLEFTLALTPARPP